MLPGQAKGQRLELADRITVVDGRAESLGGKIGGRRRELRDVAIGEADGTPDAVDGPRRIGM